MDAPNPSVNSPAPPPKLRLVEKPIQSATASEQNNQDKLEKASEAATRVAARFAAMPGYGATPRTTKILESLSLPAQTVKPLGWLNEEQKGAPIAEPADILTKLLSKPPHLTTHPEEKEPMNSNAIAETETTQQEAPLTRSLVARRLRQQGISINGGVQLSIFEVEPADFAPEEPVATLSEAAPVHTSDFTTVVSSAVEPVSKNFSLYVDESDFVEELPGSEVVSTAASWQTPTYAVEMAPSVSEAENLPIEQVLEAAPFGRRLMSGIVDSCLILLSASVAIPLALHFAPSMLLGGNAFSKLTQWFLLVALVYSLLFAVLLRVTPGQFFVSLRVVQLDGKKAGFFRSALRQLVLPLSIAPLGLGLFWNLVDSRRLCWHDRFSGTLTKSHY
jgi:uncharacterized RDD family membrane protein YckC